MTSSSAQELPRMTLHKLIIPITLAIAAITATITSPAIYAETRRTVVRPDLERIKTETTDPASEHYYPKLMQSFQSNDTILSTEDFRYLYYGYLFQEDYEPYRHVYNTARLKEIEPLLSKTSHSREECRAILRFATEALADNPFDLRQLNFLVYAYEKLGKVNLAKIWQQKLNKLLMTIASSGTGTDVDNAWIVILPAHEYDFLNLSGITATGQTFEPPYYDFISVNPKKESDPKGYYFNIEPILKEYYRKHPNEMDDDSAEQAE